MSLSKRAVFSILFLLSVIPFHACGYSLVGQSTGLPDEISKISVEVFRNKTFEPNLESYITKGILDAMIVDGRLKVVTSSEADAIITGEITAYTDTPTAYDVSRTATSYKNSLSIQFKVVDRHGMNIEYEGSVSASGNYGTSSNLQSIEASRLQSLVAMGKSVGATITSTLLDRFSLEPLLYGNTYGLTLADKNRLKYLYSWTPAGKEIFGNISGLSESTKSEIGTLYLTSSAPGELASKRLLFRMVDYSKKLGKDIALLIDRSGNVTHVIVDSDSIPDFHRMEIGKNRLSGMRLVRSNISGKRLRRADLKNLSAHRLDMVITVNESRERTEKNRGGLEIRLAYLTGEQDKPFIVYGPEPYKNAGVIYSNFSGRETGAINRSLYGDLKELTSKDIKLAQSLYTEKISPKKMSKLPDTDKKGKKEKVPDKEPLPVRRSIPAENIATQSLIKDLTEISKTIKRPIGLLIDNGGVVTDVIISRKRRVSIPEDRSYESRNLKGFRFIYTSGSKGEITAGDLAALDKHRLDFICVAAPSKKREQRVSVAFKTGDEGGPYAIYGPAPAKMVNKLMSKFKTDSAKEVKTREPADREQLEYLAEISGELNREVGILVTRSGKVTHVVVGDEKSISIPALPRIRTGQMKLNGYDFIHTDFGAKGITGDDLEALVDKRFDSIIIAGVSKNKTLGAVSLAHLTTSNPEGPFAVYGPIKYEALVEAFQKTAGEIQEPSINLSLKGYTYDLEEHENRLLQGLYFSSTQTGDEDILLPRKIAKDELISEKLLSDLAKVSRAVKRETGLMINREGEIEAVVVGDENQMLYPEPTTYTFGKKNLSGRRFIHTQFGKEGLAESGDRYDLLHHRFDMMAVATVGKNGGVERIDVAALTGDEDRPFTVHESIALSEANKVYASFFNEVKGETITPPLYGDSTGIISSDLEKLTRLYFEKIDPVKLSKGKLFSTVSDLLNRTEREIGIIFDRNGRVSHILLGKRSLKAKANRADKWRTKEHGFTIPPLTYRRIGRLKLSGYTLLHFNPSRSTVSKNDLAELSFQRLDAVITVKVKPSGMPGKSSLAYLTSNEVKPFYIAGPSAPDKIEGKYSNFIRQQLK